MNENVVIHSELNQELLKDAVDVERGGNDASSRNLDQFIKGGDLHGGSKEGEGTMDTDDDTEVKLVICEVFSVKCLNISQIPVLRQVKTCKSAFVGFTC